MVVAGAIRGYRGEPEALSEFTSNRAGHICPVFLRRYLFDSLADERTFSRLRKVRWFCKIVVHGKE